MSPAALNWIAAMPELVLAVMICVILVADLFVSDAERAGTYWLSIATILGVMLLLVAGYAQPRGVAFNGLFIDDAFADALKITAAAATAGMLVYSRDYLSARGLFRGEYFLLSLFALLGMMVMVSANSLLTLYLGLELLALSQYSLVALQRDSRPATEAAIKYFVLGALASGLLLYGFSMLYGATGTLQLDQLQSAVSATSDNTILVFGLVFVVAGFAFKLGVVPFHMWLPDVYHGAPTAVTLFIGSAPKIAALGFVLRILAGGLQPLVNDWQAMLALLALLSMALGNITAIAQGNIKRMLAYSTIAHMGFLLMGVLGGNANGYSSAMFYTVVYALMSLGAFGMIMVLAREGFEAEQLEDFRGLNQRSPWYAFLMLLLMFSLAGIPPTVGFYAKLVVLQAALEAGHLWLVIAAVLLSLIGAFYYLRVVRLMYFEAPTDDARIAVRPEKRWLISANGLAVIALGILPQPLLAWCARAIEQSF